MGEIVRDSSRSNVGGVETSSRDTLVELHELLTFFETPEEGSEGSDIHRVGEDGHQVVEDSGDFTEKGSDPLGTLGYVWNNRETCSA